MGKVRTTLKKIADVIQKAGNLEREGASVF